MKAIYRMKFDYGRHGTVSGIFVAEKDDIYKAKGYINFGEILGKHSEVDGDLTDDDIKMVTDDQAAVEMFEKYNLQTGYNPFAYKESE